jgi:hypothetical protein
VVYEGEAMRSKVARQARLNMRYIQWEDSLRWVSKKAFDKAFYKVRQPIGWNRESSEYPGRFNDPIQRHMFWQLEVRFKCV